MNSPKMEAVPVEKLMARPVQKNNKIDGAVLRLAALLRLPVTKQPRQFFAHAFSSGLSGPLRHESLTGLDSIVPWRYIFHIAAVSSLPNSQPACVVCFAA